MRSAFVAVTFLILAAPGRTAELPTEAPPAPAATARHALGAGDAVILGVIEGVTEFLPISSTGHLIIGNRLLGLDSDRPLVDGAGEPLWHRRPSKENPAGEPLTLRLAANTYAVVIQFGAIAAVALLYWQQILAMLRGLIGRDPAGARLLRNLFLAFLPAAVLGLLFNEWIDRHLFSIGAVIIAQVAGAFLMFYAEAWRHRRAAAATMGTSPPLGGYQEKHDVSELSPGAATLIGGWQCLAMWPGTSRSMTTIVGGYFAGLDPRRAAEFSFLLGLVTLTGAAVLKAWKSGAAMIAVFGWTDVLLGGVVAAVTAVVCVRFLVHWLTRHGLGMFAWYRLIVASILGLAMYLGWV